MSDLLYTVNAVMPIIIMVAIGYFLKKSGILNDSAVACMNKLVFKLLLPIMLFVNVYRVEDINAVKPGYILFVAAVVAVLAVAAIPLASAVTKDRRRIPILIQAAFRSNFALIGIPLATSLFGDEGALAATLLSAVTIPLFNIIAVTALTVYADDTEEKHIDVLKIVKGIVSNPLIVGIAIGLLAQLVRALFVRTGVQFRLSDIDFLYSGVLTKLSATATPIALIALGAEFEFSEIKDMKTEIILGSAIRCFVAPIIGIGLALILGCFSGVHFASFVSVFGTPMAVSTVPMAYASGADHKLAGQIVVFSTLFSAVGLFIMIYLLRVIGIF
ncbi:MAG: AEC family transporter [Ruminococcaceae bacterium]|nr:AEC family transporter [Oscillospiraceae bacterium]